jgi:hypothetical protein
LKLDLHKALLKVKGWIRRLIYCKPGLHYLAWMDQVILLPIPEPPGYASQGEKTKTIISYKTVGALPLTISVLLCPGNKESFPPLELVRCDEWLRSWWPPKL